jgi:mono/diheme cytochrome c family protein
MSSETLLPPSAPDSTTPADSPQPVDAEQTRPSNKWIVQLAAAGLAVCAVSAGTFHYTARGVFNRAAAASGGDLVISRPADPMRDVISLEHGLAVYAANCASCHGPRGLGDGPAAEPLIPKPRNFSGGNFKIGTTRSGLPTDDDLVASIRHGMLPAMMPPWPQLSDGEVRSLALAVRHLAIEGRVADKLQRDPSFPPAKAAEMAHAALDTGPAIVLPAKPASVDPERGKTFYVNNCAVCHDPDGRGKLRDDLVDNDENPIAARDLTSGVFKGGTTMDDIAMRVVRGIPGSPMPANPTISAEDLWSTAAYVKSLANPGAPAPATGSQGTR